MPDFKDDIPEPDDLDLEPTDELSSLDLPDFEADEDSAGAEVADLGEAATEFDAIEQTEEAGVAEEATEQAGFDPMAFDASESAELELDDEAPAAAEDEPKKKKDGLMTRLANASPYTVMLGLTLVALAAGCLLLYIEFSAYEFDIKAEDPKLRSSLAPASAPEFAESAFSTDVVRGA